MIQVGSTVRAINVGYSFITNGRDYIVTEVAQHDRDLFYIVVDDGDTISFRLGEGFEVVQTSTELARLRAFEARALSKYPDLAKPETDDEYIDRMSCEFANSHEVSLRLAFADALQWARTNPR